MRKFLTLLFIVSVLGASQARADSVTNRLGLTLPTVGGDYYTWGTILNNDLTLIDALVGALQQSNVFTTTATFNGPVYFGSVGQSTITAAGIFQGNGSGLTNIPGSSLLSGSTFYIQNTNALQAGSTAYPQFLYVGSSGTVLGSGLAINGLTYAWPSTVPGGTSALQNNGSNVLSWASGSGTNILNQNTLQAGSTAYPQYLYVGSSGTVSGTLSATTFSGSGSSLTGVILNQNSLQSGTTAYPQFLYVGSTATIPTANVTRFVWQGDTYYRPPSLVYVSTAAVTVQTGQDGTSTDAPVVFPDGRVITSTSTTYYQAYSSNTAVLTGAGIAGVAIGTATVNTTYAAYAVETNNNTNWVLALSTWDAIPANFASLNTAFGPNQWKKLGLVFNGDRANSPAGFVRFSQVGSRTTLVNSNTQGGVNAPGINLVSSTAGAIDWVYATGMSGQVVPPTVVSGSALMDITASGTTSDRFETDGGCSGNYRIITIAPPAINEVYASGPISLTNGLCIGTASSTLNGTILLNSFEDTSLAAGNNPMF